MIYLSSSAVNSRRIESSVRTLAEAGLTTIELSGGTSFYEGLADALVALKKEFALSYLLHNYFPPPQDDFVLNIASPELSIRDRSMELAKNAIKLAKYLGVDRYALHAGYAITYRPPEAGRGDGHTFQADMDSLVDRERARDTMMESYSELSSFGVECGVVVGLENLFPTKDAPEGSLMCTPDEILSFLDSNNGEDARLLLDLGHIQVASTFYGFDRDAFINKAADCNQDRLLGLHLSGNDGSFDQHHALTKDCWQLRAAARFDLSCIPVTIECRELSIEELQGQYAMVSKVLKLSETD